MAHQYGSVVGAADGPAVPRTPAVASQAPERQQLWRRAAKVAVLLATVGTLAVVFPDDKPTAHSAEQLEDASSPAPGHPQTLAWESTEAPELTMSNAYERRDNAPIADGLYPFDFVAEIHRPTRLDLDLGTSPSLDCRWTIDGYDGLEYAGNGAEVVFVRTGMHTLRLQLGGAAAEFTYSVKVSYVRREIRSMTDTDRTQFFEAMEVLYSTPQHEGKALYGGKFRSVPTLVEDHLKGSADKMCDHWHDDAGIMTHHMAFTLVFEQSLQSVNAQVAVPYWDYTIDAFELGSNWTSSAVFGDAWFGPVESNETSHAVASGRWAYLTVMPSSGSDSRTKNPYGLLRSPWNTNPTPYVLRSRSVLGIEDGGWTLPSCSDFQTAFDEKTLGDMFSQLNGQLHGPVHIMTGGQWAFNDSIDVEAGLAKSGMQDQVADILLTSKFLWRQGVIRCPETCSADTPAAKCTCSCPAETRGSRDATQIMRDYGVPNLNLWYSNAFKYSSGADDESMLDLLCHVGHAGEMFTSAAPYDPIFWSLHGLAERFLLLKIMKAEAGYTTLKVHWAYEHVNHLASDTRTVCDWTNVTGLEMPSCSVDVTCPGHRAHDLLPMGNFLGNNETYTNKEFYEFIQPSNENLPYTYDSFTTWSGCDAQNITFGSTTKVSAASSDLGFSDGDGNSNIAATTPPLQAASKRH